MPGQRGSIFLLLGMLAWIAAGFAGALVSAGALRVGSALLRTVPGPIAVPAPGQLVYVLVAASGFQGTLLLGAMWQGRRAGGGDRRAGLGIRPVSQVGVVVLLCAAMIGWLMSFVGLAATFPALGDFAKSVAPDVLSDLSDHGSGVVVLKVALVTVLAPVSEELFFRGWIWEALRRRGYAVAMTAGLTAVPWLLLHGIDSPGRILILIPAAVVFSLARHIGRSVLASLAVHMTNNMTAVLMQAVAVLFGQEQ
ncbi:MAG: type II CAAX endopeptidase family protein [Acetobacteraceae bacterium]